MREGEAPSEEGSLEDQNAALRVRVRQDADDLASANDRTAEAREGQASAEAGQAAAEALGWENAQLLRMLIQGVTDYAIFMLDKNGRVSTWNPGAERIKGYSAAEIIGSPYERFYTPEDVARGEPAVALATAAREGKYEKEGWRVRKDGRRFWAHIVLDAVHDEEGNLAGYAKVTRDITERRQAQIELQEAREALFQAQKMEAVGQLTAGIAHDFNNMLAGVIGSLDLLRTRIRTGRYQDAGRYVDTAMAAAERAAALTARLLAFGRRQPLDVKPVDVNTVVAGMRDLLRRTMGEQISITLNLDPDLPAAETDAHQLENAVLNLAINARDAMPDGGTLTLATHMTARVPGAWAGADDGPFVTLDVEDTGHGMTPEVLAKAFDPFFTTKPLGQGTGLGLSMIYGFAKQTRGHLVLTSEVGKGTRVSLHLPPTAAAPVPRGAAPARARPAGRGAGSVLVVEDDTHVRMLVLDAVRELGCQPLSAADGQAAMALLESGARVDLMVSDIGLPGGMTGRQLAEAARTLRPDLPILFITGYAAEAVDEGFLGRRMDLLVKPFTVETLGAKISTLLSE